MHCDWPQQSRVHMRTQTLTVLLIPRASRRAQTRTRVSLQTMAARSRGNASASTGTRRSGGAPRHLTGYRPTRAQSHLQVCAALISCRSVAARNCALAPTVTILSPLARGTRRRQAHRATAQVGARRVRGDEGGSCAGKAAAKASPPAARALSGLLKSRLNTALSSIGRDDLA